VAVKHYDHTASTEEQSSVMKNISEVPENLDNFYKVFPHQADKLAGLISMLNSQV